MFFFDVTSEKLSDPYEGHKAKLTDLRYVVILCHQRINAYES